MLADNHTALGIAIAKERQDMHQSLFRGVGGQTAVLLNQYVHHQTEIALERFTSLLHDLAIAVAYILKQQC